MVSGFASVVAVVMSLGAGDLSAWAAGQAEELDSYGLGEPVESMTLEGALAPAQTRGVDVRLEAGAEYTFAAACEDACGGVTLDLSSADGAAIAAGDGAFSVHPVGGAYRLKISLADCGATACRYVVRVYRGAP